MLELLMQAEAQELCGKWHGRNSKREAVRWGKEKGVAIIKGVHQPVERSRVRVGRGLEAEGLSKSAIRGMRGSLGR